MPYHLHTEAYQILSHTRRRKSTLTSSICISQLLADHSRISAVPEIITHCPPLVIDAHLHSTFILGGASHQTDITISAGDTHISYSEWEYYMCITDKILNNTQSLADIALGPPSVNLCEM